MTKRILVFLALIIIAIAIISFFNKEEEFHVEDVMIDRGGGEF